MGTKKQRRKGRGTARKEKSRKMALVYGGASSLAAFLLLLFYLHFMHPNIGGGFAYQQRAAVPANITALFNSTPEINGSQIDYNGLVQEILPNQGYVLSAKWGNIAERLVAANALNVSALSSILNSSGEPLTQSQRDILSGKSDANITLNSSDAIFTLDVLWGVGISNNNPIITNGPIMDNGNPDNFASTGGYGPLGDVELGMLNLVPITQDQQDQVGLVAYNSYRPCCDNPTAFPDCNHGAAVLALVEIMTSQGNSVDATFKSVKEFDSFYFTQYYLYDAIFLRSHGIEWNSLPASYVVGYNLSSLSGAIRAAQYDQRYGLLPNARGGGGGASCTA